MTQEDYPANPKSVLPPVLHGDKYHCPYCWAGRKGVGFALKHVYNCKDNIEFRYDTSKVPFSPPAKMNIGTIHLNRYGFSIPDNYKVFIAYWKMSMRGGRKKRCHFAVMDENGKMLIDKTLGGNSWSKIDESIIKNIFDKVPLLRLKK